MDIRNCCSALVFGVFFLAQQASASDVFAVSGSGASSCGQYLEARSKNAEVLDLMYGSWLQGFLSAANLNRAIGGRPLAVLPDTSSMLAYIDKYCANNPLKAVYNGALDMNLYIE